MYKNFSRKFLYRKISVEKVSMYIKFSRKSLCTINLEKISMKKKIGRKSLRYEKFNKIFYVRKI